MVFVFLRCIGRYGYAEEFVQYDVDGQRDSGD